MTGVEKRGLSACCQQNPIGWDTALKNGILVVALIVLLVVAAGGLYVLNDPAAAMRLAGIQKAEPPPAAAKPAVAKPAVQGPQSAGFDRKSGGDSKPPSKSEADAARTKDLDGVLVSRKGRYVGPVTQPGSSEAPLPELYPFSVNRRTYPDEKSITVEVAVKNASGVQWKTAYVAFRAPKSKSTHLFEIRDWQIDETVGFDYSFPRTEVQDRLTDLRIVSVSGEKRQSALADRLQQSRRRFVEIANASNASKRRARGETLAAGGLLGALGRMQSPVTGISIQTAELRTLSAKPVTIQIPEEYRVPGVLALGLRETSDERKAVSDLAQKFHVSALAIQDSIDSLGRSLQSQPYDRAANSGPVGTIRENIKAFNAIGVELATKIQTSTDQEVRKVNTLVLDYSRRVSGQVESVESQVKSSDPGFRLTSGS